MKRILFVVLLGLISTQATHALGTFSEGWAIVMPTKFEQAGIIFDSFEGTLVIVHFDRHEKCDAKEDLCFAPQSQSLQFSVRPESAAAVKFIQNNVNKEMWVHYRIHRFTAMALKSDFEIVEAAAVQPKLSEGFRRKLQVAKTGSERSFSLFGKILRFENRGRVVGTYEGIYYDKQRDKVHAFSVTNEEIAKQIIECMKYSLPYYFGISQAYVTGMRETDYDVFEINYDGPANQVQDAPADKKASETQPADKKPEEKTEEKKTDQKVEEKK